MYKNSLEFFPAMANCYVHSSLRDDPLVLPLRLYIAKLVSKYYTSTDGCQDGNVRLVDGDSYNEGRVELCIHEKFGSISDEGWSAEDAQVVCTQLGFRTTGSFSS